MTGRPHRAVRPDENQAEIVADLKRLGAVVWRLSDLGGEVLDLLVCWRGLCVPVEVKQPGHESELTDGERDSIQALSLVGVEAIVATCAEDVLGKWPGPRWQVVNQAALKQFNVMIQDARDQAVQLSKLASPNEHVKKRIYKLRDALFQAYDLWCQAVERR